MKISQFLSLCAALLLCCTLNTYADITPKTDTIRTSETWSDTIEVTGDITIMDGVTLTISPGTRVEFMGHYKLEVIGELLAIGIPGDTIRFTKTDTIGLADNTTTDGSWRGIWFGEDSSTGTLSHCIVEFANGSYSYKNLSPIVVWNNANLIITNSVLRYNYGRSGAVEIISRGEHEIRNNLFLRNRGYSGAGALYINENTKKIIEGNHFIKNRGIGGGAIAISYAGLKVIVRNNFISQNEAAGGGGGMSVGGDVGAQIIQNLIVNNVAYSGGGLHISYARVLVNNVICNNNATYSGGGIACKQSPLLDAANNIIWGNRIDGDSINNINVSTGSAGTFRNCLLEGGVSSVTGETINVELENILDGEPAFQNATTGSGDEFPSNPGDWKIDSGSACINAGISDYYGADDHSQDYFGADRINYGHIDLGVHEYHQSIIYRDTTYESDQVWIADTIKIQGDVIMNGNTNIYPGVVVQFQSYSRIYFNDTVHATGTADAPILFTIADTSGFYNMDTTLGNWSTLEIFEVNSRFTHCHFKYGEGIRIHVSDAIVENCLFDQNIANQWHLIFLHNSDHVIVRNCIIRNNTARTTNTLDAIGGQGLINVFIEHNQIYNNDFEALRFLAWNIYIRNNLIYNNRSGIHLFYRGDFQYLFNNTLANNGTGISYTGGSGIIANNIIYNSNYGISIASHDYMGELAIYNNLIDQEIPENEYAILENNIIADPLFVDPTSWKGYNNNFVSADYSVYGISPAINAGRNSIPGHSLPTVDIMGNNRILNGQIDIGAFEHTGQKPVITNQPNGGSLCEGESKELSVNTAPEDSLLFQWQKDGVDLIGADSPYYTIDSLLLTDAGNYRCMIWNSFGTTYSDQVYLNVKSPAKIYSEPESRYIPVENTTRLSVSTTGSIPINYQWFKDGIPIPGANLPEYLINTPEFADEGIYTCRVANSCDSITTTPALIYLAPQICMVTVSEATGDNLIVWEKASIAPIEQYNIYRESKYAGIYDLLATIPNDDLSVFVDSTADPGIQAYLYKITGTDTSGYETDPELCTTHKTIHLLATTNPETNATQLDWDRYVGFDYGTYEIYRSDTTFNFNSIHEMSSSTSTWADTDPGTDTKFYRIAAVKPEVCTPTGNSKAGAGPYRHALSNLDDNKLRDTRVTNLVLSGELKIYPNPVSDRATIQFPNPDHQKYRFILTNITGKVMHQIDDITDNSVELSRNNLSKGLYLVELRGPEVYRGKLLIE